MSDKEQKKEETSAVNEKNGELLRWVTFNWEMKSTALM